MSGETDGHRAEILRRRAERLAERRAEVRHEGSAIDMVLIDVGRETLALPAESVREITALPPVTPVPGLPPYLVGITHLRGELVSVLDLGRWLGIAGAGACRYLVWLDHPKGPLGLLAERVAGFRRVWEDELDRARHGEERPVAGVTRDLISVLDVEQLWERPDLLVS